MVLDQARNIVEDRAVCILYHAKAFWKWEFQRDRILISRLDRKGDQGSACVYEELTVRGL